MRNYLGSKDVDEMWSEGQRKAENVVAVDISGATKPDSVFPDTTEGAFTRLNILNNGFSDVVVDLEKSDTFRQRLSIINSEVERQLRAGVTWKELSP